MTADYDRMIQSDILFLNNHKRKSYKEDCHPSPITFQYKNTYTEGELNDSTRLDVDEDSKQTHNCKYFQSGYPLNKFFTFHYQIGFYTKNDFLFEFSGSFSKKVLLAKTQKLNNYPFHLKITLFPNDKVILIRKREFTFIEISFNELKEKGNKMYKKGKYRDAIKLYIEAYGLLRWLEFKDKSSYSTIVNNQKPILDEDIIECSSISNVEADSNSYSSNDHLVIILLCMSYGFIELHHYNNALECLDECLTYDEINPIAFLRRSQARMYNKNSSEEDIDFALSDIQKAISIYSESKCDMPTIYTEHYNLLNVYILEKKKYEEEKIENFLAEATNSFYHCYDKTVWTKKNLEKKPSRMQDSQWEVLQVMKKKYKTVVKYYNETQNEEQFNLACEEIEQFMDKYKNFKYFYNLDIQSILKRTDNDTEIQLICDHRFRNFLEFFKHRTADSIFQSGKFNIDLIKYAIGKVNQEIKLKEILESESNSSQQDEWKKQKRNKKKRLLPKNLSLSISIMLLLLSILFIFAHYFLFLSSPPVMIIIISE